jgi:hypothetical protein
MNTYLYKDYQHSNKFLKVLIKADSKEVAMNLLKQLIKETALDENKLKLVQDNSITILSIRSYEDYLIEYE